MIDADWLDFILAVASFGIVAIGITLTLTGVFASPWLGNFAEQIRLLFYTLHVGERPDLSAPVILRSEEREKQKLKRSTRLILLGFALQILGILVLRLV